MNVQTKGIQSLAKDGGVGLSQLGLFTAAELGFLPLLNNPPEHCFRECFMSCLRRVFRELTLRND